MIKAVLFDLDGVLVDSFEAWWLLLDAAAHHFGCPPVSRDQFRAVYGQPTEDDVRTFFQGQTVEELESFFAGHFSEFTPYVRVEPEASRVVAALRQQGVGTAVITNTATPIARFILDEAGIEPDALVGSTDVPRAKPAPDMVQRACELLNVLPTEALVVGDSRYDYQAAEAAGTRFAGLGVRGGQELTQLTDVLDVVKQ